MYKYLFFFCLSGMIYGTELIEEAFVTYATANYFPLIEVLLDSAKAFSTRPVIVFGINADVPFSTDKYPFLIKRRLNVKNTSWEGITLSKPQALLNANVKRGVFIDADLILNRGCDAIFSECDRISDYPLCPIHPNDVSNQQKIMQAMNIPQKTQAYVHDCVIVFSEQCRIFLEEWNKACKTFGHLALEPDETVINVLFWKHQLTNWYIPVCDPYYMVAYDIINDTTEQQMMHGYSQVGELNFYFFHGNKDPILAKDILNQLILKES